MTFGFVGLGQMGAPMATNLCKDHDVRIMSLDGAAMERISQQGARIATGPQDFADVDLVILCLPGPAQIQQVLFDETSGLLSHLKPRTIIVDTGTTQHAATLEIAQRVAEAGFRYLDAPVSGMQKRAEDATLTMMVGGDAATLAEARPALTTMASKVLHMGDVGAGQLTKLVNQLLFDINAAALAEILPMAVKLGLDPEQTAEVVNSGTGRSYASEFFVPRILQGHFGDGYPMQAAYKDLISGAEISAHHALPTPVLAAATGTYQQALAEGHGDKDKGAMILTFERLLGVIFRSGKAQNDG